MIRRAGLAALGSLLLGLATARAAVPPADGEKLEYQIGWPSGLDLGTAKLEAVPVKQGQPAAWQFSLSFDIAVPGLRFTDHYATTATENFCTLSLEKQARRLNRQRQERIFFDYQQQLAKRQIDGGPPSEFPIPACARDLLGFLYFLRRSLEQGRLPGPQTLYFGSQYRVAVEFLSEEQVQLAGQTIRADRLSVILKDNDSETRIIVTIARDASRTPVKATIPFLTGNLVATLVQ